MGAAATGVLFIWRQSGLLYRIVVPVVELGVELGVADKSAYMEPALQAILQG
ncbi:hypothetical protein ACFP4H_08545 [Pseudophaeobacter arcticus]|uniref:hypothetical protein n=1 Tax=Pseudophaeobacter arcticus TaxID=385492 RepID=UPI000421196C|nr:hypothetical protein [Pseudophaeobacter arcticus]